MSMDTRFPTNNRKIVDAFLVGEGNPKYVCIKLDNGQLDELRRLVPVYSWESFDPNEYIGLTRGELIENLNRAYFRERQS